MMKILKKINNNIILATDSKGKELVVMGKGISFGKKIGQQLDEDSVEKIFCIENKDKREQFKELLSHMPLEYVQLSNAIITYAKDSIKVPLNQTIYLTLTDHIGFAIERYKKGMDFSNALYEEIKIFYPKEYLVGRYALYLLEKQFGIKMKDDEAASIALHFVNAEYNSKIRDTFQMTRMIQNMMEFIEKNFQEIQKASIYKDLLMSNLKYTAQRMINMKPEKNSGNQEYFDVLKSCCLNEYEKVTMLSELLKEKYECYMTEEEKVYLAISIRRAADACHEE